MAADLADRLDDFDLGLVLRKPEDDANDRATSTDPWYPVWCLDWGVTRVHLSVAALCVTVRPRRPSALTPTQARGTCKEELRTLLRFVAQLAAEYGLLRPVVGIVLLDTCSHTGDHARSDSGNDEPPWVQVVRDWGGDQDWHRGEFLLFVETDHQEYCRRCLDLLAPAPDAWSRTESPEPRKASEVLAAAREHAGKDELCGLFDEMQAVVESDYSGDAHENPLVRRFVEWLNAKLRTIDARLPWNSPGPSPGDDDSIAAETYSRTIAHPGTIARIRKLRIRNFRGFGSQQGEPFEIDLDADLVLLAGPNGLGKTTLIEALDLLLTGYHHFRGDPQHLFHGDGDTFELAGALRVEPTDPASQPRTVTVTCAGRRERDDHGWKPPEITWSVNGETGAAVVRPLTREFQQRFGEQPLSSDTVHRTEELLSRRTAVYPDRLDELFDETTTGTTLRDWLDPLHPVVSELLDGVRAAKKHLSNCNRRIREEAMEPNLVMPQRQLDVALEPLQPHYRELAGQYAVLAEPDRWPSFPKSGDEGMLSDFVHQLLAMRGESAPAEKLPRSLPDVLEALRHEELRRSPPAGEAARKTLEKIEAEIEECKNELAAIDDRYPQLDEDVKAFDADEGEPDLAAILEALCGHVPAWRAAAEARPASLAMLTAELRRVLPEDAAKCAEELRGYLHLRRAALEERDHRRARRNALEVELRRARNSERAGTLMAMRADLRDAAAALRDAWQEVRETRRRKELAAQAQDKLEPLAVLAASVDRIIAGIEGAARVSDPLRKEVEGLANGVLSRLAPVGSPLRVALQADESEEGGANASGRRRSFTIRTDDGRERRVLSFGQRTQVGVALVIAENRLLEPQLGHRVFLMDDLSATYDLANLSRDTIFWRQMAYGDGEASASARQVFLSSHHEDLSNRLLDVLPPVAGHRMLLYRFTGWRKGTGPAFQIYDVDPQPALDAPGSDQAPDDGHGEREDFRKWLQDQLTETVDGEA